MSKFAIFIEKAKIYGKSFTPEETYSILAAMPFYFVWVPILTWYNQTALIRKICLYSAINTGLFFIGLFFAQLFSIVPFIGNVLSNLIHLIAIVFYLGFAGFLIYSVRFKKTIEIPILSEWESKLESNLAPIAQLDRVSDYGSEG
jgi:hypothetical protein